MVRRVNKSNAQRKSRGKAKRQINLSYESLFSWPNAPQDVIEKLKEFGYKSDEGGVCHGVACVAAHAMLLNKLDEFDRDLQCIKETECDEDQNQPRERTFLESIELCHQPYEYPHLFSTYARNKNIKPVQHALTSLPLVESTDIALQGGVVSVGKFSGVYDRQELIQCLHCLRLAIEKLARPMALMLSDEGHIIAVQYHPQEKVWLFVDLRSLPSRQFDSEEGVARAIAKSLTPALKKTVMSGMMLVTRQHEWDAKKVLVQMMRSRAWKKTQGIDETKMRYLKRWLFVAAYEGCEKEVAFLLANNVDPNGPVFHGLTPLTTAAFQGHFGVANLLLLRGARVNDRRKGLSSSLFEAVQSGHDEVAALLREHGARFKKGEEKTLQEDAAPE